MCTKRERKRRHDYQRSTVGHQTAELKWGFWGGCRRGDSTHLVLRCSPLSILCLKWLFSVRSVLCFIADVRRRCCTSKRCTATFDALREGALFVPANSLRH